MSINPLSDSIIKIKYEEHKRCAFNVLPFGDWLAIYTANTVKRKIKVGKKLKKEVKKIKGETTKKRKKRKENPKRCKIKTLDNIALEIGFSKKYFSNVKYSSREKYDYIFKFDKDLRTSVFKFLEYMQVNWGKMRLLLDYYGSFKGGKLDFSRKVAQIIEDPKVERHFWNNANIILKGEFSNEKIKNLPITTYKKWDKIINHFENNTTVFDEIMKGKLCK